MCHNCENVFVGLELTKGFLHKFVSFNRFELEPTPIPEGYELKEKQPTEDWIKRNVYDPTRNPVHKNDPRVTTILAKHKGWIWYMTHWNGGRSFIVYIKDHTIAVYRQPTFQDKVFLVEETKCEIEKKEGNSCEEVETDDDDDEKWHYMIHVATFTNVRRIFVGKSPKTATTEYSGGYGEKFDGNSILVHVGETKYIHIGAEMYSFTSMDDIVEYYSPVGNSDVPQPVAIGTQHAYFMLDKECVALEHFTRVLTQEDKEDLYAHFYFENETNILLPLTDIETKKKMFLDCKEIYASPYL